MSVLFDNSKPYQKLHDQSSRDDATGLFHCDKTSSRVAYGGDEFLILLPNMSSSDAGCGRQIGQCDGQPQIRGRSWGEFVPAHLGFDRFFCVCGRRNRFV